MNLFVDTHILLWAATEPARLAADAPSLLRNETNTLFYSAASLFEITIKLALGREDLGVDPHLFRRGLRDNGYRELPITVDHTLALQSLPALHKDPFDRILLAQTIAEGMTLVTADRRLARYPGPIRVV